MSSSATESAPLAAPALPDPRTRSWWAVVILSLPLVLGLLLRIEGSSASLFGLEGPECAVGRAIGPAGCPGCGLTRATGLTLQGDLDGAAALNWAGIAVVLACLAGLAVHLDILVRAKRRTPFHQRLLRLGARGFLAAVFLAWFARLLSA
ncbi:MAG: DUF2752 domain-containing protein [Planctomycetota bacterium]|nr:DUF2752 domain-containing protein [Planctomycetota bacterium]